MIYKNDQQLINIIKFSPPIFIIIISIIITFFLYLEKQINLSKEIYTTKNEFIKKNKESTKNDVDNIYDFIIKTQKDTEKKLKESIKSRVYEAHDIALKIYTENKNIKNKNEIKKMIKDALVNIRFNNGRGYFFITSLDYECILLPTARELEGTSFYNLKDSEGVYIARKIVSLIKKDKEGFLSWSFSKPNNLENQYKKIGFNMYFEPYDWYIGTGEYIEEFEEDVKKEVLEYISRIIPNDDKEFFILDHNQKTLFNTLESNILTFDSERVFEDMLFIAQNTEAFLTYKEKDKSDLLTKSSYIRGIPKWNWILEKSFYQDDVKDIIEEKTEKLNNDFHKNIMNIISIAIVFTIILLLCSFYLAKIIDKKFKKHKIQIQEYINENTQQQHILFQQSKMAAMGEMLGNIAHQWRQPLSVITTAATGMKLQKELEILDDESFGQSITNITDSALYLSKTIDDFRNFFKTDKIETNFDIVNTFEKVFKLTDGQFTHNDILFIKNIEDTKLYGLENELIQALINILNNSKDALIELEKPIPRVIFIDAYKQNEKVIIKIKDNAGGVDKKIIDKVCEPYFTTKHQSKGTGIGLYMTSEIIKKHMNGTLKIANVEFKYENKIYKGLETTIEVSF
ncbi:cache domain-containing protein [Arcobacter sp. s6]|jgi:signal transduction histidine kinase|uniref:sensor histidine kinase n=1 Tax=Arcobacter sp. s6 TaxID=3230363 RepID=UPI00349FEF50